MDREKATEFIVKELARHHSRDRIILELCERGSMNYHEAQQLVKEVESSHGRRIAQRQSPLIILFSVGLLILGIGLTGYNGLYFWDFFQAQHTSLSINEIVNVQSFYYRITALVTGLGMILGGIIGSWQMIGTLLKE